MQHRNPGASGPSGDVGHRHGPGPSGLEILAAERLVWASVAEIFLVFGAVGACALMGIGVFKMWAATDLAGSVWIVARILLIGVVGFLGGLVLAGVTFAAIRAAVLVDRWLTWRADRWRE
jgi:hypothetical protein